MIGDIIGKGGRLAVKKLLPNLREELEIDAVIGNVENLAHGKGITQETVEELFTYGVDMGTSGNHIYDKPEGADYLDLATTAVVRPANFPTGSAGRGYMRLPVTDKAGNEHDILVINLIGQVFMNQEADSPFETIDWILNNTDANNYAGIFIDFHAEATSEILGLSNYVDGRVSGVVSTHTHVPTADLRKLPKGTYAICDLGMVGGTNSMLGFGVEEAIERFVTGNKVPLQPVESGSMTFNSVLFELDVETKQVIAAERVDREISV